MYTAILILFLLLVFFFAYKSWKAQKRIKTVQRDCESISFLLENVNDGIIEYDQSYKVIRINKKAEQLIGEQAHDVVSQKVSMPKAGEKASTLTMITYPSFGQSEQFIEASDGGKGPKLTIDTYEVIIAEPAKRKYKIFTVPKISADSNKPIGFVKIIRDITREDIISHSKSDLVAVAAHQLRSPLANAKWIFSAILDGDYGALNDKQKNLLEQGAITNESLVKIVDDILDVSKIEGARFEYVLTKQNLIAFIQETIDSFKLKARSSNINLIIDLPSGDTQNAEFTFDTTRIKMVIGNLIDNAICYSKAGGSVAISVKIVGDEAKISVRDSGIGIPKASQTNIFSKFYRADNAKLIKTHGTGLGLFLAKTIVEGHGGTISYTSEQNVGTTFTVTLPRIAKTENDLGKYESMDGANQKVYGL